MSSPASDKTFLALLLQHVAFTYSHVRKQEMSVLQSRIFFYNEERLAGVYKMEKAEEGTNGELVEQLETMVLSGWERPQRHVSE
ncbi:hypothetical protein [Paenibacillus qinlingensis]|uniref:hypothetical protein n=1 Tax=Paenibacillus qinlingensis TaxID=1837343 RepID=UPI00286E9A9C|nr:hypothetical protein [Paenibacillus qinlingensis]